MYVEAGSDANVLRAMEQSLRQSGLAVVVGEITACSTATSRR